MPLDRITVSLTPKGRRDLDHLAEQTGMSTTDLAVRGLGVLRLIHDAIESGDQVAILRVATGATETIHLV